jgi:galactose mutarotase-like enzyme
MNRPPPAATTIAAPMTEPVSTAQLPTLALSSPEAGGIEAVFVPGAGMVGCSLRHRGEELLGQRDGLKAYVAERKTMGIPLLYPWANRIGSRRFTVAGREVVIDPAATPLRLDDGGLPMHGLLSAVQGWEVEGHDEASLGARFDFGAHDALMAAFPFAHELRFEAALTGATLRIATTVLATGGTPVPIAFGFHPYLRLPGVPRPDWEIAIPVREQLRLDARMLPTGERVAAHVAPGRLDSRTFDTAYTAPEDGAPFVLAGGGRRVELAFEEGYRYTQVFAPAEDDVIAFEPMTARTNALVDGGPELPILQPGESYRAAFSIAISDAP